MINGLDIPSYNLKIKNSLHLTGTNLKGRGCNIKAKKKEMLKNEMVKD